jgi:mannose-6-phosphate isomerase
MGAHPKAPSRVLFNKEKVSMADLIRDSPEAILGITISKKFSNRLPFLFKVLAAAKPLSIQAHPNRLQAEEGYEIENMKNISLDSPDRNYRDRNHKPELICALEPLSALKGFRGVKEIYHKFSMIKNLSNVLNLDILLSQATSEGLNEFFISLMNLGLDQKKQMIETITEFGKQLEENDPVFYWINILNREYTDDIGVLSPMFLNLITLQPGEALFIPAGELHAYLDGAGIELMANSDNVLRGGLTQKHIDIPELSNILSFSEGNTEVLKANYNDKGEGLYPVMAEEFELSVISLKNELPFESSLNRSVEIMLCTNGEATISDTDEGDPIKLSSGVSIMVPADLRQYRIQGEATIYKASVPL